MELEVIKLLSCSLLGGKFHLKNNFPSNIVKNYGCAEGYMVQKT